MTAIEYINSLDADQLNCTATIAYSKYVRFCQESKIEVGAAYSYFRTKFNAEKRQAGIVNSEPTPIEITTEELVQVVEEQGRVIKNYKNGDVMPEPPSLIPTGTLFDELASDRITTEEDMKKYLEEKGEDMPENMIEIGGFTRKCVDITAGKAGSGKTFSRCILAAKAKIFMKREYGVDIRVGFISGEMRESEWAKEIANSPLLTELEVDYMLNYVGQNNYEDIFWEAVGDYDIVIIDSFPAILGHIRMSPNEKRVEKIIINDFIRRILQTVEENNNNVQLINQCNKDGNYKGGTELPHMLSSLSFVMVEGRQRYTYYEKNRNNGNVGRKAYFSKTKTGDIEFNEEAFNATYKTEEDKKTSMLELIQELTTSNDENSEEIDILEVQRHEESEEEKELQIN